jgi:hypothetical protein
MAQVPVLKIQDEFPDAENRNTYPTTCLGYLVLGDDTTKIHLILGTGAPSTNYNNAPYGSLYWDLTNYAIYIKDAATSWGSLDITT